uniref:Uncharacterized protein AlNc14C794G12519 n=1 Tax=Albugo laibachii Nc14 TaxID=890382 RepID=F0X222_9STRA|nr:hypothetical protein ALNC14_140290 [Albugo laibachii Nc14]|eukprot:CCA27885.1 hypothetical protein ALNC14_140290 [Albugo laibachii Nc14]
MLLQSSQYGGQNAPIALPPSYESQALVPVVTSNAIVPACGEEQVERATKRHRIEEEQANAALEAPPTYQAALQSPQSTMWKDAIEIELKALRNNKTWTPMKRHPNQNVIGTKWVFAIKRNEHGNIERYKARLVALGY